MGTIFAAGGIAGAIQFQVHSHERAIKVLTSTLQEMHSSCSKDRIKNIESNLDRLDRASRYRLNTIK